MAILARRLLRLLLALVWCGGLLTVSFVAFGGTASAEVKGAACDQIAPLVKGESAEGRSSSDPDDAIEVGEDEVVPVSFQSTSGLASHRIRMEYAGFQWDVSDEDDEGQTQVVDEVDVGDYAVVGAGLYKVMGEGILEDGSRCVGAVLIDVGGNPLTTALGLVAAVLTALGAAGLVGSAVSAARDGSRTAAAIREGGVEAGKRVSGIAISALSVLALMAVGAGIGGGVLPAPTAPRARWRPKLSVWGIGGGLLFGLGGAVLLQQYSVRPMTQGFLVTSLVVGLVLGILIPSLVRIASVGRVNQALAAATAVAAPAAAPSTGVPVADTPAPVTTTPAEEGPPGWAPTHVVPPTGMWVWTDRDPTAQPSGELDPGLGVRVTERSENWARIVCSNGFEAWVDARQLVDREGEP